MANFHSNQGTNIRLTAEKCGMKNIEEQSTAERGYNNNNSSVR